MPEVDYRKKAQAVQALFTQISQRAGRSSGFVERHSKMSAEQFVQTMILGCLQKAEMSLSELAQTSTKLGVGISGPGLDQRIDAEAVILLQTILQEGLQQLSEKDRLDIAVLRHFTGVYLLDSTQMELPAALADCFPGSGGSASPAALKVQVLFEYLSSTLKAIELGPAIQPDQNCRLHLQHTQAGALHVFDLGYFHQQVLAELDRRGAFFVTRLDYRTGLFSEEDPTLRLELLSLLRGMHAEQLELPLRIGCSARLPVRALFVRLPPAVVEERRRKVIARMRAKGKTPSQDYLEMLAWNFFITNVPAERLSFAHVLLLYRLRWQIELVFKLWKSEAHLDRLGPWRKERLLVQLYARLIGLVLFYALSAPFRWLAHHELSLTKAFRSFHAKVPAFLRAIHAGWHAFPAVLKRLAARWLRFDRKTHRCKSPSTLELLLDA